MGLVQQGLAGKQVKPVPTPDSWIRASSLATLCDRAEVLAGIHKVERVEHLEYYQQLTFDMGKGVHWTLQNNVLPQLDVLVGEWRCRVCGRVYGGPDQLIHRPKRCTYGNCVAPPEQQADESSFEYVEQFYQDHEYRVQGHPDGFLEMPEVEGLGVLEAKSASDFAFKKIKDVPDFGHVIQVQTYLWLTGLKWGIILYWNKGAWKDPVVQHFIERDDDAIESIKQLVLRIRAGLKTGELPARTCSSIDCKRAEVCDLAKLCFKDAL